MAAHKISSLNLLVVVAFLSISALPKIANAYAAQDPVALQNASYLNSFAKSFCGLTPERTQAITFYLQRFPSIPNNDKDLMAYETGMVANLCTNSDLTGGSSSGDICFSRAVQNSRFSEEYQLATSQCSKHPYLAAAGFTAQSTNDCYSQAFMKLHDTAPPSCMSRLADAQQKLQSLDSRVSNSADVKNQLDSILQILNPNGSSSGQAK
jgi:hypothetical protein